MALALNSSNPLAGNIISLIGVDPSSGVLVDLKRAGVTFTLDAGVTYVDTALGRGVRTAGSAENAAGFTISPAITQNTFGAHELTIFMVVHKMTGRGSNGSQPARLPVHFMNGMSVGFDISTGNVGLNPGANTNANIVQATPAKTLVDSTFHSLTVRQWNASAGWNTLEGDLYIDGAYSNASYTGGMTGNTSTDVNITGFAKSFASSWQGDFVWMVVFNKKLSPAEISDLHASLAAGNNFALVTGAGPVAAVPAGTVTVGTVTPASTTASVPFTYSGSDSTGYEYRLNGGSAVTVAGGASPISLTGLTAGTAYTVEVRATNATGAGAWSASKSFTTTAAAPAGTVTIGTVTVTSGGASVPFTYSGSDATGYDYRINGGTVVDGGTASPISVSGLTASTNYTVEVRAKNAGGTGAWSASKSFTTSASSDVTAPTLTGTVTSSSITSSSYTVTWPAGTDNVAVTGYEYRLNSGAWVSVGNALTTSITGRTPSSTDTFEVRAYDAAGNRSSALSKSVTLLASATASLVITEPLTIAGLPAAGLTGISAVVVQSSDLTYVCKLSGLTTDSSGRIQGLTHASMVVGTKYDVYFKHLANKNRGHKVEVTAS